MDHSHAQLHTPNIINDFLKIILDEIIVEVDLMTD
jgi:hypothetical protein